MRLAASRRRTLWIGRHFFLATMLVTAVGCSDNKSDSRQTVGDQQDPEGEFEWAMTRLERALRQSRPTSTEGLVTTRDLEYELFPPSDAKPKYTARVTVVSETSFLHGQRESIKKEEKKPEEKAPKLDDPIAPKEDEYAEFVDIPGVGPGAPPVAPTKIDTRRVDAKSVFELEYVEGTWRLAEAPEQKHEQLWFEYALQ